MAIISQETWDNMPENEKEGIINYYYNVDDLNFVGCKETVNVLKNIFGKENLQIKPKIKTWEDVKRHYPKYEEQLSNLYNNLNQFPHLCLQKMTVYLQIQVLIELGYGGLLTNKDWNDDSYIKYGYKVFYNETFNKTTIIKTKQKHELLEIAFKNKSYQDDFEKYPENTKLIQDYFKTWLIKNEE